MCIIGKNDVRLVTRLWIVHWLIYIYLDPCDLNRTLNVSMRILSAEKMGKGVSQAGNAASSEQHFWAEFYDSLANNSSWSTQPLENLNICRGLFVHFRIWDTKMSLGLEQLELNQSEKYAASNSRSNESLKMHLFQAGGASKLTWSNSWRKIMLEICCWKAQVFERQLPFAL